MSQSPHYRASRWWRVLVGIWLGAQLLLLLALLLGRGLGVDPDLRLASAAVMVLISFPSSLIGISLSVLTVEKIALVNQSVTVLVWWFGCFVTGGFQLWVISKFLRWMTQSAQSKLAAAAPDAS